MWVEVKRCVVRAWGEIALVFSCREPDPPARVCAAGSKAPCWFESRSSRGYRYSQTASQMFRSFLEPPAPGLQWEGGRAAAPAAAGRDRGEGAVLPPGRGWAAPESFVRDASSGVGKVACFSDPEP